MRGRAARSTGTPRRCRRLRSAPAGRPAGRAPGLGCVLPHTGMPGASLPQRSRRPHVRGRTSTDPFLRLQSAADTKRSGGSHAGTVRGGVRLRGLRRAAGPGAQRVPDLPGRGPRRSPRSFRAGSGGSRSPGLAANSGCRGPRQLRRRCWREEIEPRLGLRLREPDSPELPIVVRRLDDFHPDALYHGLEAFGPLRDVAGVSSMRPRSRPPPPNGRAPSAWRGKQARRPRRGPPDRGRRDDALEVPRPGHRSRSLTVSVSTRRAPGRAGSAPARDRRVLYRARCRPAAAGAAAVRGRHRGRVPSRNPSRSAFQALESVWRSVHGLVTEIEADAWHRS